MAEAEDVAGFVSDCGLKVVALPGRSAVGQRKRWARRSGGAEEIVGQGKRWARAIGWAEKAGAKPRPGQCA